MNNQAAETPMDFETARFNMIQQQIRPWEVHDERVLDLMARIPREDFVPPQYRGLAFADVNVPLGHGEVMMSPKVEARLLQALDVRPNERVLEVGTGSGYLTACLAKLGQRVVSVEIRPDFVEPARQKLAEHGIDNVSVVEGDAVNGWSASAPYDVIAVTGSLPLLTEDLQRQLTVGGRLFVIVGQPPIMEALLITRTGEEQWVQESLFDTVMPPLQNAPAPPKFRL